MIPCEALVVFKYITIMEGVEMQERLLSMEKFVESGKPVEKQRVWTQKQGVSYGSGRRLSNARWLL